MEIRAFRADDWAQVWAFFSAVVAAGETYTYPHDLTSADARARWVQQPPGRTVVAVEGARIIGTAKLGPNHGGPGSHVANASFMVDPAAGGRGVGTALVEHVIEQCRADGYRAIQFNA